MMAAVESHIIGKRDDHKKLCETIKLIDELVDTLKQEQQADAEKKVRCKAEIDKTEDDKKILQNNN